MHYDFCNYSRTNGHTPGWCRKKIRDGELMRRENERTAEKKVTFTQDHNKKRGPDHGSEQWTRGQNYQRRNQKHTNGGFTRDSPTDYQKFPPKLNFAYEKNHPNNRRSNQSFNRNNVNRSRNGSFNNQHGNWRNNGNFSQSPSSQRREISQNSSYRQPRSDQFNNSAFRRPENQPMTSFTH